MPLPMMAGDPAGMLLQPGMMGGPPPGVDPTQGAPPPPGAMVGPPAGTPGTLPQADPRAQARGAVELVSQAKATFQSQMEALVSQFPGASQSTQQLMLMIDKGVGDIVRTILMTLQAPEPPAPATIH
jgi:hypothetical protein